jgi:enoyl-CoA hydratase/carnithine racemase
VEAQLLSTTPKDFSLHQQDGATLLTILSSDGTNRLDIGRVLQLTEVVEQLACAPRRPSRLVIVGNEKFFSAGADLEHIRQLKADQSFEFARAGQRLMSALDRFPRPVLAAIRGYCMGGGLDLALTCDLRIASPQAIFGHRGAALGLITGWGGTQRLSRLLGKAKSLELFLTAARIDAYRAQAIGLISGIAADPEAACLQLTL